ncbi:hypothetical protein OPIT5_15785 [Opitutaceae bacterium TAV5]|nr:hypothetical protein OPIT5_15785 [Opitutaceae bacterium TAV5]
MKNKLLAGALAMTGCLSAQAQQPDRSFLNPPGYVGPPQAAHAVTNRAFQGISSMAVSPGGRLWVIWYAGVTPGEDRNNYVVLATSGDGGKTWKEVLVVDPDGPGPVRAFDPEVWMGPDGRLRLYWAQAAGHDGSISGTWTLETGEPESEAPAWSAPARISDGIMMCKSVVLSTGEWALPVSTWRKTDHSAKMLVSTDQGRTWSVRGACHVPEKDRSFDEHMLVERGDGSLRMLVRTRYGIGESISTDRGVTWPELVPSAIPHPSARFFITRLHSGNLLLVKHGPMDQQTLRSHLTAFISTDDGRTWGGGLLLDERTGVSYPDGQQAADGTVYITYDFSRTGTRHILFATFREEDAAAGEATTGAVRLRQLVSEASGGQQRVKREPSPPLRDHADGEPLRVKPAPAGAVQADGASSESLSDGQVLFTDRKYTAGNIPAALDGARFLRVSLRGNKTVRCTQAATVYFLTPEPDRNRDSQSKRLEAQGFKKVALPEIPLFNPENAGNYVTLYRKDCAGGEEITFGQWAVPVFFLAGGK